MKLSELFKNKRKFLYGANETILIIGVLVVAILLNVVVGAIDARTPLSVDLSANQMFALSGASREVLGDLKEDVNIYHLTLPESERPAVTEVLKNYERESDYIHVEKVNYEQNPTFVAQFTSQTLSDNSLIVECGGRSKSVDFTAAVEGTQFVLEQELTNTILSVVSGMETKLYYTGGHGEADFSPIASALSGENVVSEELNLLTGDIPEDCSLLWMNAPTKDFGEEELGKIDAYLKAGGSVQVSLDAEVHPEKLCALIESYGLSVNDDIVAEMNTGLTISSNPFKFIANLNTHEITEKLSNYYIQVFKASSLSAVENDAVTLTPLLATSTEGASYDLVASKALSSGTQMVSALSENYDTGSVLHILASSQVFTQETLQESSLGNLAFLISLTDYLTEGELSGISVEGKDLTVTSMLIPTSSQNILWAVTFLLLPIVIFGFGIYVWQKRRHL